MNVDYFEQMEKDARASTRKVLSLESDLEEQKRKKGTKLYQENMLMALV